MTSPSLQRWIDNASERSAHIQSIYSLIFGIGTLGYFFYRTRLQLANLAVRLALHVLEYFLIFKTMPAFLLPMMLMRIMVIAIESGWWGMLDPTRQRIRLLSDKGDVPAIRNEIEDWLAIAQRLAGLVVIAGVAGMALAASTPSQAVLIVVLSLNLAAKLLLRTLYSGAYALRRVYMRFEWIIGAELVVFALAWLAKPVLGVWTMPLCLTVAGVLTSYISYYFTRYALDFMQLTPRYLLAPLNMARVKENYTLAQLWQPAMSMIAIRIHDVILILTLQFTDHSASKPNALLFILYLIIPAIRTALTWAQVLYFDLVKGHLDMFGNLRRYFERAGLVYGVIYGVMIAALAVITLLVSWPDSHAQLHLVILYLLLSSLLGFVHVSLFARGRFYTLAAIALLQYVLLFALCQQGHLFAAFVLSISIPTLIGLLVTYLSHMQTHELDQKYLQWVRHVEAIRMPLQMVAVELSEHTYKSFRLVLLQQFRQVLGKEGACCFYKQYFLCAQPVAQKIDTKMLDQVLAGGAGYVERIHAYEVPDGREAMLSLSSRYKLPTVMTAKPLEELENEFTTLFPTGYVQLPTQRNAALVRQLTMDTIHDIVRNTLAQAEGNKVSSDSEWYITTLQRSGLIEAIFLVKKIEADTQKRQAWLAILNAAN